MLNLPELDYLSIFPAPSIYNLAGITKRETRLCQVVMQVYTNEVLRYMDEAGSSIRLISSFPSDRPIVPPVKDGNGHRWPEYNYRKRKTLDGGGVETVVAAPLAHART